MIVNDLQAERWVRIPPSPILSKRYYFKITRQFNTKKLLDSLQINRFRDVLNSRGKVIEIRRADATERTGR
jgi:hypothetical protein